MILLHEILVLLITLYQLLKFDTINSKNNYENLVFCSYV